MLKKLFLFGTLVIVLFLAACDGKSAETQAVQPCYVGTWQIADGETFFLVTIPPGAFEPGTLKYIGGGGSMTYTFQDDGKLVVAALPAVARFDHRSGNELSRLEINVNGFGSGKFQVEDDLIKVGPENQSEINFVAKFAGEEMMNSTKLSEFAPLFVPPFTTARFTCSGDKLTLTILNQPNAPGPIEFKREQ
jgi:hypothetical protein